MQGVFINHIHSGLFFPPLVCLKIEPNGTNVVGEDYSLTCTAMTDIPGDTFEFYWYYNNAPVNGMVDSSDTKSKLSFKPLNGSHKGEYTCKCSLKQRRGCFSRILLPNLDSSISYHLDVTGKHHHEPIIECHVVKIVSFTLYFQILSFQPLSRMISIQ